MTNATSGGQAPAATGVGGQTWSARCGNAIVEEGELCDDGNSESGDGCSATCLLEAGWVCATPGQACDQQHCGDGMLQAGEACDLGQANGSVGATCAFNCRPKAPSCGDGVVDSSNGERCDEGVNDGRYGGCAPDCTLADFCGDGLKNGPEECDLAGVNSGDPAGYGGCTSKCTLEPYCGDGVVNGPEQCDDGLNDGRYGGCMPGCNFGTPYCGDGVVNGPEQCDDGTANGNGSYGGCTAACKLGAYCGDGSADAPEECDLGFAFNTGEYGGCTSDCKLGSFCGDGIVNGSEECDYGSLNGEQSLCTIACKARLPITD